MGGKTLDKARLDLVYESKKSEEANGGVIKDVRSNDGKHEMDIYYTDSNDNIRFVSDIKTPNQNIGIVGKTAKELVKELTGKEGRIGLGLDDIGFNKYIMGIGETTKSLISNVIGG